MTHLGILPNYAMTTW